MRQKVTLKFGLIFAWFDFWVGFYWNKEKHRLYFFPIPMFGIFVDFRYCAEARGFDSQIEERAKVYSVTATPELLEACKKAAWLYDEMALGPLEAAAKYGPDYEPPTDKECLEIRQALHDAISKAQG